MGSASKQNKYVLRGCSDALDGRLIQFVDDLPACLLVCSLCSVVPFEHYSLSCKHVYCCPCFSESVKSPTTVRCPLDGEFLGEQQIVLRATANFDALRKVLVYCCNKDHGCSYKGTLEELQIHVQYCYEVSCGLCYTTMLRPLLADHVVAAHSATTPATSSSLKRGHEEVAVPSTNDPSDALVEVEDGGAAPEVAKQAVLAQAAATAHDRFLELVEAAAARAAEDEEQVNGTMSRDIFGSVNVITVTLSATPFRAQRSRICATNSDFAKQYTWTVSQYSKFRVGTHHVVSPMFIIAPGCGVQITVRLYGTTLFELSVSVKVRQCDDDSSQPPEWPFQNASLFTLFNKSGKGAHLTSPFTPNLFKTVSSSTEGSHLVSTWLTIGKMERTTFERDYVEDDGFSIGLSI
ncbi:hypothetical protein HPB50_008827 [Hyalomma asiaticum]|uniref:Uncharacterized protein n=1 Tax=Hyalomma asiaticum TaxID=266040 RepID=A0ACB7THC5_HYAAI|nr:hypothetical protein HPB50_008827 [Hyalomma asiaticum]